MNISDNSILTHEFAAQGVIISLVSVQVFGAGSGIPSQQQTE